MLDIGPMEREAFRREAAIVGGERQPLPIEGFGQQRDMAEPERALAPFGPMERDVEIDARGVRPKAQGLFNRAERRWDHTCNQHIVAVLRKLRLRPFEIGDLGLARLLEDAVARVPIGLQRDVVEMPVRQPADDGNIAIEGEAGNRQAAAAVEPRGNATRFNIDEALLNPTLPLREGRTATKRR